MHTYKPMHTHKHTKPRGNTRTPSQPLRRERHLSESSTFLSSVCGCHGCASEGSDASTLSSPSYLRAHAHAHTHARAHTHAHKR